MTINPRSPLDQLLFPHECFTALRESGPILYNEQTKIWEVFNYEDVHTLISNPELFSSDTYKYSQNNSLVERDRSILTTDPPLHRQMRSLVSQAFTPKAIAQLAPRITEITNELLDQVIEQGHMDVIGDLSYPLPVTVIAEMLGIPTSDRAQFKKWSDDLVTSEYEQITPENIEEYRERIGKVMRHTLDEMYDYFRVIVAERRRQPGNDLISALIAAEIEGKCLPEQDILSFCALLLVAGNITTTNLIGDALLCFDEHPDALERLQREPALISQAIEEVLRYRSPVTMVGRFAAQDVTLAGQKIPRGQFVLGWVSCANHDPAQFPDPGRFDVERSPNHHLSFGHGIHFCLGAPLARLESKIALTILLERIQDISRDRDQPLETIHSSFIYGPKHLPITFRVRH
jgi:cytochrome P450